MQRLNSLFKSSTLTMAMVLAAAMFYWMAQPDPWGPAIPLHLPNPAYDRMLATGQAYPGPSVRQVCIALGSDPESAEDQE